MIDREQEWRIHDLIAPIVQSAYGRGEMSRALLTHLATKIPSYAEGDRQRRVMLVCWDFFSGGSTAESVAAKIEGALIALDGERDG